jgi:hypothetical protein
MNWYKKASSIKLFLDDIHNPPDSSWTLARTAKEAISILSSNNVIELSLDHDLNDGDDGIAVAKFLEEQAYYDKLNPILKINLHTDNPVGRNNMKAAINGAIKYWQKNYDVDFSVTNVGRKEMGCF